MVSNATFNNISVVSWRSVLLLGETGVPGENQGGYLREDIEDKLSNNKFRIVKYTCFA
jgi:hypothetical protein